MSFASPRLAKSQAPRPSDRRSCLSAWRPLLEQMEDRVVLTAAVNQQTVIQLYQDLLHRLPDAGGLAYWAAQLDAGADTKAVATALAHSNEFHRGEVDGVYQRLLGRAADAGGMTFFASALDAGQAVQQVEAAVASSPEYAQAHGGGFLDALFNGTDHLKSLVSGAYQQVLHRAGDAAGLAYWAGRMADGVSLDDVTANLAVSPEKAVMPAATSAVLGTFSDASALPVGAVGGLETVLAGSVHAALGASASGSGTGAAPLGVGTQGVTLKNGPPAVFQAFGPERLVDTRNTVSGQYGGPAFAAGGTRTINVAPYNLADPSIPSSAIGDQAPTSNLPNKVVAVSVILFIVGAPTAEYFTAYATGTAPAPTGTASVFADHAGQIIAASAIVPVNASGNIDIYSSGGGNLIVDVNGYFLNTLDGSDYLPITGNVSGNAAGAGVVVGTNTSTTTTASGIAGVISSTSAGVLSSGVFGLNNGTDVTNAGVWGRGKVGVLGDNFANGAVTTGIGVEGLANAAGYITAGPAGIGVAGAANTGGTGVFGTSLGVGSLGGDFSGDTGVRASGTRTGVTASATGTGTAYGVLGQVTSASAGNGSAGVRGVNGSGFLNGVQTGYGVLGEITSTDPGQNAAAVRGINHGTNGNGYGVYGSSDGNSIGVEGSANADGIGVLGIADGPSGGPSGVGVYGSSKGTGVVGNAAGSGSIGGNFFGEIGVQATGTTYGVLTSVTGTGNVAAVSGNVMSTTAASGSTALSGTNLSTSANVYGVVGSITSTTPGANATAVRGFNSGTGANGVGVWGSQNGTGWGVNGTVTGAGIGVRGVAGTGGTGVQGTAAGTGSFAVQANGNLGTTGVKNFVDPNPLDPSKQIAYVSLEGPEAGTYFRGTGHFTGGVATIDVPETFRLVTDAAGLTVQITPLGSPAGVAVTSKDLNHITLVSTQDVDFDYLVNGVRKGYAGYDPLQPNRIYVPHSATDTLPTWLTDTQRQTLISNGTYNTDGTVNLTIAHNLGWDRLWTSDSTAGTTPTGTAAAK